MADIVVDRKQALSIDFVDNGKSNPSAMEV